MSWRCLLIGCCQLLGALCASWSVFLPRSVEVLAGSCVLIPCRFEVPEKEAENLKKPANGVWRKRSPWFNGSTDVFNSSWPQSSNILQGEIIGDLLQKNCTSILDAIPLNYTDVYYFRIETGFKSTFIQSVTMNVIASPRRPKVTSVGQVMEGTPVNLTCWAPAPCPKLAPALTWWPPGLGHGANVLLGDPGQARSVWSTLNFVATPLHRGRIACRADYPLQPGGGSRRAEEAVTLRVLYPPKNTTASVSPSELVTKGTSFNLTCTSDGSPQVERFFWFRARGGEVAAVGNGSTLSLVMAEDHRGLYHCQAQNQHGIQNSTAVRLSVPGAGATAWISGAAVGGVLLLCGLLLLCRRRQRKLPVPVVVKQQGEDDSPVYGNISMVTKLDFAVRESRKDADNAVYSNFETLYPGKTDCLSNTPVRAEMDDQLYANCFIPSS